MALPCRSISHGTAGCGIICAMPGHVATTSAESVRRPISSPRSNESTGCSVPRLGRADEQQAAHRLRSGVGRLQRPLRRQSVRAVADEIPRDQAAVRVRHDVDLEPAIGVLVADALDQGRESARRPHGVEPEVVEIKVETARGGRGRRAVAPAAGTLRHAAAFRSRCRRSRGRAPRAGPHTPRPGSRPVRGSRDRAAARAHGSCRAAASSSRPARVRDPRGGRAGSNRMRRGSG